MNTLTGHIESVNVNGSLSLVRIRVADSLLSAVVIDTPETVPYLQAGHSVHVIFKETEVIIGRGEGGGISLQNRLAGKVHAIQTGVLLSKIVVDTAVGMVTSIITTNAVNQLGLKVGSDITAMIKTNELMLSA